MQINLLALAFCFIVLSFQTPSHAKGLTFNDVLEEVFSKHPELAVAKLQIKMRETDKLQLEGSLDTRYGGSVGFSDEKSPATNAFSPAETNALFLSGQVTQPFAGGSTLTGSLNYNRSELTYPSSVPSNFQASPNPIFQHQIDLIYRYPLASGAGNPSYHLQKEASEQEVKAAALRVSMLKEQLANQAIGLFFQLILNDLSLDLANDAVLRAQTLLAYQKRREKFGLIESSERLQADALLATRKLQQAQAQSARDISQSTLNRLMYREGDSTLTPVLNVLESNLLEQGDMLHAAEKNRSVFRMFEAQYAAAEARLSQVRETDEHQLDLVGQIGSRALDGSSGAAFGQGFTLDDRYIALRLEFSDVFDNKASRSAIQRNVLALESISLERMKTIENLKTEIANLAVILRTGRQMLKVSKLQVAAEKRKFNAEMERYREGRSSTLTITQFEGDLRSAELRSLIQKVSLHQAEYQLALTMGVLQMPVGDKL